jgi:hypothetical protein
MRFRQGGFVNLPDDYREDPLPRMEKEYYWWHQKNTANT